MGYYSALISREILTHTTTQMNLEDIMPSEINQSREGPVFLQDSTSVRSLKESVHRDREQNGGGQRLEGGGQRGAERWGNWYLMRQFQLGKMKRLWRWMGRWLHNDASGLNATELHT